MSDVHSYQSIRMAQLLLLLANQLIKIRDSSNIIRIKTLTKLADLTGRKWWLPIDTNLLILQKATTKQEYYQLKKKLFSIILTYLEERARKNDAMGKKEEGKHLHVPIYT